jgi:DNA helicase-2/ATP-dependent DNA helicase PcrA
VTHRLATPDTCADTEIREVLDAQPLRGFVVVAGAGSGKTTSLVKALAHVATTHGEALTARGQKVACITYTEVAAAEIESDVRGGSLVHVSTIHSFLWTVIRPFQTDIGVWLRMTLERKLTEAKGAKVARYRDQLDALKHVQRYTYGLASNYGRGSLTHNDVLTMVPELIVTRPLLARLIAGQFPYVFVDESQDTAPKVVESLKSVARAADGRMALGFFGDPMQQIYMTGVGEIATEPGWATIHKPENFRSSERVLRVVNRIRSEADGLQQVSGLPASQRRQGDAWFFALPADDARDASLERVRAWLTANGAAGDWTERSATAPKVLMIVHEMAAKRLGFHGLFAAFNQRGSRSSLGDAFKDGAAWPLDPFKRAILPLTEPGTRHGVGALRSYLRTLAEEAGEVDVKEALKTARAAVDELRQAVATAGPGSVERTLRLVFEAGLVEFDARWVAYLNGDPESPDLVEADRPILDEFLKCDVAQLRNYFDYVETRTPYSTQHGTKGTEYPRVLLVLDDGEGTMTLYSYEKLLGLVDLSETDRANQASGKDSVIERTRRLLYVSVSRAMQSLAVVLFVEDVEAAIAALRQSGLPGDDPIYTLDTI